MWILKYNELWCLDIDILSYEEETGDKNITKIS